MSKRISPTQRTLAKLRSMEMRCGIVEKFNKFGGEFGIRQDLFGFIDIVALDVQKKQTFGVQCTGKGGHSGHKKKIVEECREAAIDWINCGNRILLISWDLKKVKRGGAAVRWHAKIEEIKLKDLTPNAPENQAVELPAP